MTALPFLSAFVITLGLTPLAARFFLKKGITGVDLHKEGDIEIPEMVGVTIYFSILSVLAYHYFTGYGELLAPLIGVYVIGTLGIADGLIRLSAAQKIVSFSAVGLFLAWAMGYRDATAYIAIGFLFMVAVNFTNMLAGFNGLEIGTGAIAALGLTATAYLAGQETSFIVSSVTAGALLGFLYYNRYPAKVFPGDVGTLIIGAALFSSILLGGLYTAGLVIFIPYVLDAGMKFLSAGVMTRESQKPTQISGGMLTVPEGTNMSLARLMLKIRPMTEKQVVRSVWVLEALFVFLAISLETV